MKQSMSNIGTVSYMAPEIIVSEEYDIKVDVFSFGILMYEVVTGTRAYREDFINKKLTPVALAIKVKNGYRPPFKFPVKKGLKKMIELCWSMDPKDRPTFCEIFLKLSLLDEDEFVPFKSSYGEANLSKINVDDDSEPENMKFCLPDVDTKAVFAYVEKVSEETMLLSSKIGATKDKTILDLKKENEELKKQIMNLTKQSKVADTVKKVPEIKANSILKQENKSPVIKKTPSDINSPIVKPQLTKPHLPPIVNNALQEKVEAKSDHSKVNPIKKSQIKIKYNEFRDKYIKEQISIISEILSNSNDHPFFLKLQKFLNFFNDYKYDGYIYEFWGYNYDDEITNITKEPQIKIRSKLTDIILDRNWINNLEFIQILKEFDKNFIFEIDFPSYYIESKLSQISSIEYIHQIPIEVLVWCSTYEKLQPILKQYPKIRYVYLSSKIDRIEPSVFAGCNSIKYIEGDIIHLGNNVFKDCTSLQKFYFKKNIEYIGDYAFYNCSSIQELVHMLEFDYIGNGAFMGCTSLKRVELGKIANNKYRIFEGCSSLEEVKIEFINNLKSSIFEGCVSLKSIIIDEVNNLNLNIFCECTSLETLIIKKIKTLDSNAFNMNKSLKIFSISYPNFDSIRDGLFEGCSSLIQIEILSSAIKQIGSNVFNGCSSLEQIKIPSTTIKQIGKAAFKGCSSLRLLEFESEIDVINESMFENCSSLKSCLNLSKVSILKPRCFSGCSSLGISTVPKTVKYIPSFAFEKCSWITHFTIPPSVKKIDSNAFSFCTSLVQILLPTASLKSIGSCAFSYCISLMQITIPSSVSSIGSNAFFSCTSLKQISLPSTLRSKDIGLESNVIITTF